MSFTAVALGIGARLAKAMILGANVVEGTNGSVKGNDKRALAIQIATEALGFCQDNRGLVLTPRVQEALNEYTSAYVALQNALAAGK